MRTISHLIILLQPFVENGKPSCSHEALLCELTEADLRYGYLLVGSTDRMGLMRPITSLVAAARFETEHRLDPVGAE